MPTLNELKGQVEMSLGRSLEWHEDDFSGGSAWADLGPAKYVSVMVDPPAGTSCFGGDIDLALVEAQPAEPENAIGAAADWMTVTNVGIEWHREDPMPLAMYGGICRQLGEGMVAFRWAVADLLNYGDFKYGDTYHQYSDLFGLALETLKQWKRIGKAIPLEERDNAVKWSYWHRLAALEAPDRKELVERIKADEFEDALDFGAEVTARIRGQEPAETFPACPACGGKLTPRHCRGCGLDFERAVWWLHDIKQTLGELPKPEKGIK